MSSGNPFRASQAFSQPAPVPQTLHINTDSSVLEARSEDSDHVLEDAAAPPPKTKKSVRILSPTTTIPPHPDFFDDDDATLNELMARRSSQARPASPPPPVAPAGFANTAITAGEANAQVIGKDAMATADALPGTRSYFKPQAVASPGYVPANPFSKTLASLEPQEKEGGTEERANAQKPPPGNSRASLDVESFKNLLMTGKATPRASGQSVQSTGASQPTSGAQFESSSSTDTSSISRQSLFEYPHEAHAESPRTSVDMAESDEDDSMGLVSEVKRGKKKPPPAPKHRHGKLVTPRQPQTVSFDSFEPSEPSPPPSIRRADSSDVNKPLPPTPNVQQQQAPHISSQDTTPFQSPPVPSRPSETSKPSEGQARAKRTPPPVPLARRQSQLKTTTTTTTIGNRSRSSSNLTVSSQHSIEAPQTPTATNHDPMTSAKSPPPPPPSRYGARLSNVGNSSANSSSTELPYSPNPTRTPRSVPDPPSPRRSIQNSEPSSPAPSVHRASSISSNRNTPRNISGGSTGSNMPPPPPPRRRQSNRSSLDQQRPYANASSSPAESRRTSTEHRRTSVASESSLRREYAPVDEDKAASNEYALYSPLEESERRLGVDENVGNGRDTTSITAAGAGDGGATAATESRSDSSNILDDMEKFQQEIEALRTRYAQKG